jgi:hypothetical protein
MNFLTLDNQPRRKLFYLLDNASALNCQLLENKSEILYSSLSEQNGFW